MSESKAEATGAAVSIEDLAKFDAEFDSDPRAVLARNAVAGNNVKSMLVDRKEFAKINHFYSVKVGREGKATSQKSSGRCWIFAAMNVARQALTKKYNLPASFELSQTFLFFYDKVERANYFLEAMITTAEEDVSSRLVQHLLTSPVNDGGQWSMIVALVEKYGLCPKSAYPDAHGSTMSRNMNLPVTSMLRQYGRDIRVMKASGSSIEELRAAKVRMVADIHRMVTTHLGTPPKEFDWAFNDKDGKHHVIRDLTPMTFYREHVPMNFSEYYSIVNDPRNETGRLYTVEYLGNVVGGPDVLYINVTVEEQKAAARAALEADEPVWFGCHVSKDFSRDLGVMSTALFDYTSVYGCKPDMSKADRLVYGDSLMTHAMVFTGVDIDEAGKPSKWRVENSWGGDIGDSGYCQMSDDWFSEFNYQVVVHKKYLTPEQVAVLDMEPTPLPAWDPMGALATDPTSRL